MCGRFTLRTPLTILAKQFEFDLDTALRGFKPRYNIAPTQTVLVVRQIEQGARRELAKLFWALIPSWPTLELTGRACHLFVNGPQRDLASMSCGQATSNERLPVIVHVHKLRLDYFSLH
jgi:putative SOS response-associated peptidase YedK